jgi:preprotein translocase SecE subunit
MTYRTTKQGGSRFRVFGEVIAELKKVVWLSRREVAYLTVIVLIISIIAGLALGFIDIGFANFASKFFLGG